VTHAALSPIRPDEYPHLEVTDRANGSVGWFLGTKFGVDVVAELVDALWGGPDEVEVTEWRPVGDPTSDVVSGWKVTTVSASHGTRVFDVRLRIGPNPIASSMRRQLSLRAFNLNAEPESLEHLLWNLFVAVADNISIRSADDEPFSMERSQEIYGPWAPPKSGWNFDKPDEAPYALAFRLHFDPVLDDAHSQQAVIGFIEREFTALADEFQCTITHNLPATDRDGKQLVTLRSGLGRLEDDGWTVIDDTIEWPHRLDDPPSVTVEVSVTCGLVTVDEVTDHEDELSDEEILLDFYEIVPFDRATLDAIEARMAKGEAPDTAMAAVTGSPRFPAVAEGDR
jgi:hypothetical protein